MNRLLFCMILVSASLTFGQAVPPPSQVKPPPRPQPGTLATPPATTETPTAPPAPTTAPTAVVLKVGTETYTREEFERLVAALPERSRAEITKAGPRKLAEQLVDLKVAAQEARRRKIDQTPAMKYQLALQAESLLANALYGDLINTIKPSEEDLKAYYEKHKNEYQQVKARHILVRFQGSRVPVRPNQKEMTDAEALAKAQELTKRLAAGEDFAAVAKTESDDTGSGANGGDLGAFGRGQMVPQFDEVVFTLPPGKVSDPVKTQFGYHLIQVQQQLNKSFDEVKSEMEQKLKPELAKKQMEDLRKAGTVTIDEGYFGK